jgi:glycosyltransferase involved in cell wall biosynthesis
MKILLIGGASGIGGATRYTINFIKNLKKEKGVKFKFLNLKEIHDRPGKISKGIELICKFPKQIDYNTFDIVHYLEFDLSLYGMVRYIKRKKEKPKIIETSHGMRSRERHYQGFVQKYILKNFESYAQKYAQTRIDGIIYVSDTQRDLFLNKYNLNRSKTYVVYLASSFKPYYENIDRLIEKKENTVLFVGRFERRKRIEKVLELATLLPDLEFEIIGTVVDNGYFKELQKLKPRNCEFLMGISDDELIKHYQKAKYFISFSEWESCPITYLESISQGTPVIAYSMPIKAMEDAGCGYEVKTAHECVSKMRALEKQYDSIVQSALRTSKLFSWEKVVEETVKIYKKYAN